MAAAKPRLAILISGRGSNMAAILDSVRDGALKERCEVAVVFSNRAEVAGLTRARELGVPVACLESRGIDRAAFDAQLLSILEPYRPDWLVLAGYMRLLSPTVVRRYPNRIVNIHPADTARHQGLHGYRWAFEQRLPATRITVHLVDEGLDTGEVLAQREVDLRGARTLEEVEQRGLAVERVFYSQVLAQVVVGRGGSGLLSAGDKPPPYDRGSST